MRKDYGRRRISFYTPSKEVPVVREEGTDMEPFHDRKDLPIITEEVPDYAIYADDVENNQR